MLCESSLILELDGAVGRLPADGWRPLTELAVYAEALKYRTRVVVDLGGRAHRSFRYTHPSKVEDRGMVVLDLGIQDGPALQIRDGMTPRVQMPCAFSEPVEQYPTDSR